MIVLSNDAKHALQGKGKVALKYKINNICRNIGTRVSGIMGYTYGDQGLPAGSIDLTLNGSAGQSFDAFLANGILLRLFGEANDYVGKGMNGGTIVVRPQDGVKFDWSQNVIIGNTCLYGATGGRLHARELRVNVFVFATQVQSPWLKAWEITGANT